MRILLVAPRNPESFWTFDRVLPILGKRCLYPNLALPTLAALTPPGHEVVLCDENIESVDLDADADLVGITGYVVHRRRILELAKAFRRRGRRVALGGPFASLLPDEARRVADIVFVGEAEHTWPRFLEDDANGDARDVYVQDPPPDITDAPPPRFDLLKLDHYQSMVLQTTRGCPYQCEFCDIIVVYGRRPRSKSVERVLGELDSLRHLGARNVFIVDDNFIGNRRYVKSLLHAVAAWQDPRRPVALTAEVTLNLAQDAELLSLLPAAGLTAVFIGIESPRPSTLHLAHKEQNTREPIVRAVHRIQEAGLEVMAGMIVGFDQDDPGVFEAHARFLEQARIPISMTGMLNALPRTPLYERLRKSGRLLGENVGDQFARSNIRPAHMTSEELAEGYVRLLKRIYEPRAYHRRARALLSSMNGLPAGRTRATLGDLLVLSRFFWHCIVRTPPAQAQLVLRLLLKTALRQPRRLRQAISLSLLHIHLHDYTGTLDRSRPRLSTATSSEGVSRSAARTEPCNSC